MILIAHRGNINGPNPSQENNPSYVEMALQSGYHIEIDVWLIESQLFLGHDNPQYLVTLDFLQRDDRIICHAKTIDTLQFLLKHKLHCFFHDKDSATLTSHNLIWLYPGMKPCEQGILVMPEWESIDYGEKTWLDFVIEKKDTCYGVCSDYVGKIRELSNPQS